MLQLALDRRVEDTKSMIHLRPSAIGQAAARAVAQRVHVAEHTLGRHHAPPNVQDDLADPATVPLGV